MAIGGGNLMEYLTSAEMSSEKRRMEEMKKQQQLQYLYGMAQAQSPYGYVQSGCGVTVADNFQAEKKPEEPKPNHVLLLLEDL